MCTTITNSTSRRTPTVGAMDARTVCYVYEAPNRNLGRLSMAARAISNNATLDRSPFTYRAQEVRQRASSTHMRTSRALLPPLLLPPPLPLALTRGGGIGAAGGSLFAFCVAPAADFDGGLDFGPAG